MIIFTTLGCKKKFFVSAPYKAFLWLSCFLIAFKWYVSKLLSMNAGIEITIYCHLTFRPELINESILPVTAFQSRVLCKEKSSWNMLFLELSLYKAEERADVEWFKTTIFIILLNMIKFFIHFRFNTR